MSVMTLRTLAADTLMPTQITTHRIQPTIHLPAVLLAVLRGWGLRWMPEATRNASNCCCLCPWKYTVAGSYREGGPDKGVSGRV